MAEIDENSGSGKHRSYCMTIHNWTQNHVDDLKQEKYKYIIIGNEICPTTNRPHLQLYIQFPNARAWTAIKKSYPTAHIEVAGGTPTQNKLYCSKEKILYEDGTLPRPGNRSDIEVCRDIVQSTNSMREVVNNASSIQGVRIAEIWLKYNEKPRTWKPIVTWIYGPSGTGKTKMAYEILGNECYTCMKNAKWFEGYDAHENVLIDELRSSFCSFHSFLRLIDRYEYRIECKGSSRQFLAKNIVITSAHPPDGVWLNNNEDMTQITRRIDKIIDINKTS